VWEVREVPPGEGGGGGSEGADGASGDASFLLLPQNLDAPSRAFTQMEL